MALHILSDLRPTCSIPECGLPAGHPGPHRALLVDLSDHVRLGDSPSATPENPWSDDGTHVRANTRS